ncbi:MAG: DNA (cytosine-5-)-methyltransferase [Symploca sp. SIO2G7]|nr:DNA (cytosine-5-)-methyltransferase [Symploca sp. SIO2G7]
MKILDLCSGVGAGFPFAALKIGGFELIGLAEIDDYCQNILSLRYPNVKNIGDIKSYKWSAQPYLLNRLEPDIITASPPCQPFSVQGKRLAGEDDRDCFPAILEAIATLKPSYFAIENVPGLLTAPAREQLGGYFRNLLYQIHQRGYDAEWTIVSSGSFGAPWLRRRLLLVGKSSSIQCSRQRSWADQIGNTVENFRSSTGWSVNKSGVVRETFSTTIGMDKSSSRPNGSRVNRSRRKAVGNSLDWRVAFVGLRRIQYYETKRVNS